MVALIDQLEAAGLGKDAEEGTSVVLAGPR
jgi:hypothetical protein